MNKTVKDFTTEELYKMYRNLMKTIPQMQQELQVIDAEIQERESKKENDESGESEN